jgi:hypothetical protein
MKSGEWYRINSPTVGIISMDHGKELPFTIPSGAVFKIVDLFSNDSRMVDVQCDGHTIRLFAEDLHDRGELIQLSERRPF